MRNILMITEHPDEFTPSGNLSVIPLEQFSIDNTKVVDMLILDIDDFTVLSHYLTELVNIGESSIGILGNYNFSDRVALCRLASNCNIFFLDEEDLESNLSLLSNTTVNFVLPCYNESSRIEHVRNYTTGLGKTCRDLDINYSITLVDDGSTDNTLELLEEIKTDCIHGERVEIVALPENTKKAGTYIETMKSNLSDYYIYSDSDDTFAVEDVITLYNLIRTQDDYSVVATKDSSDRQLIRHLISFAKRLLTSPFLPKGVTDSQTGLKWFSSSVVSSLASNLSVESGLAVDLEIVYLLKKLGIPTDQLEVICIDRECTHVEILNDSLRFLKTIIDIRRKHKCIRRN